MLTKQTMTSKNDTAEDFHCKIKNKTSIESGYVLPLVIISGLIILVGAVILSTQSFSGLIRTTRQKQRGEAIEIAETGSSILINKLNSKFPYLLTISCQTKNTPDGPGCIDESWESFKLNSQFSACPGRLTSSADRKSFMKTLNAELPSRGGSYRLVSYEFLGDKVQGGTAIIQVEGQRQNSQAIASSAIIEKEVTIVPKYCNLPPFVESEGSTGYGLLANLVTLKKSDDSGQVADIIDQVLNTDPSQANVHCNDCAYSPNPDKSVPWRDVQYNNSKIDGERSKLPPQPLPPSPIWDPAGKKKLDLPLLNVSQPIYYGSVTINHNKITKTWFGTKVAEVSLSDYCHTEEDISPPVTHCRAGKFELSSIDLTIDPGEGEIRFYFEGDKVSFSTDTVDILSDRFGQVAFFGNDQTCKPDLFDISGSQSLGPIFIHMPCTKIALNGDGEIIGSVIAKEWYSKGFDLVIPSDASQIMKEKYGISFEEDKDREFAALGTNRWSLIQAQQ